MCEYPYQLSANLKGVSAYSENNSFAMNNNQMDQSAYKSNGNTSTIMD